MPERSEINTVHEFYQFLDKTKKVTDISERTELITKELSFLKKESIINFEKFLRKELIRVCHYNVLLLAELNYPTPVVMKAGKIVELDDPYFSTDMFIYFRCGVILLGENEIELLLEDPNNIIGMVNPNIRIDAEGLLYCARHALEIKGSKVELDAVLDMSEHYDFGNYSLLGENIKWYDPKSEFPELVEYYDYEKPIMEMPDSLFNK